MAVRVTLCGQTPIDGELFASEQHVRDRLKSAALALGTDRLWIEKVRIETHPRSATRSSKRRRRYPGPAHDARRSFRRYRTYAEEKTWRNEWTKLNQRFDVPLPQCSHSLDRHGSQR